MGWILFVLYTAKNRTRRVRFSLYPFTWLFPEKSSQEAADFIGNTVRGGIRYGAGDSRKNERRLGDYGRCHAYR